MSDIPTTPKGSIASAISSAVVQLMREYTGRGPTKARTYIDEDLITVVLQDTLTMGERSLVRDGELDLVLTSRRAFQRTMRSQLIAADLRSRYPRHLHPNLDASRLRTNSVRSSEASSVAN